MAIVVATIILTIALAIAYQLGKSKSKKRKYCLGSHNNVCDSSFALLVNQYDLCKYRRYWLGGNALISIMLLTLFLIGLVILLVGVFRKNDTETIDLFK